MQNTKKQVTEKQRRNNLIGSVISYTLILLYFGARWGYFFQQDTSEMSIINSFFALGDNFLVTPWRIWPTHLLPLGIALFIAAIIFIFEYNKYLVLKDTVENAHGDAFFEEDYDQYEKEFVCDPAIISKVTKKKMTKRNCPRNEEGKKVFTGIKKPYSSPRHWKNAVEECRRQSMVYSDNIYLSLNGGWCQRNTNSIVFGASGTGKSRYFLKPNILQDNGSFICTDPSGDIMQEMGDFLKKKGYTIKCFNLSDMTQSCRFNPLHYIRDTKDIAVVVQTYLTNMKGEGAKSGGDGEFWDKASQALMCCVIGYLYEVCPLEQRNFSNVLEMVRMDKHEEDEQPGTQSDFDLMFEALGQANPASYAYLQYQTYTQAPVKTRNNILISLSVNLQQLDIPEVRNLTYKDELELDKIGSSKMALFLNIPQADKTFAWLSAMLYSMLFKRLYSYGEQRMKLSADGVDIDEYSAWLEQNHKTASNEALAEFKNTEHTKVKALGNPEMKTHVRFLIDECANVGKIPDLEKYLATCRKYRISIVPIFQNYSQIVQVYGKDQANNIVSNCDVFVFLGGSDEDTLKIIQGHLGKTTVKVISNSYAQGKGSNSSSKQQTGQDLMTRDQIETMMNSECLVFIRALRPFHSRKYDLNKHPNYKYLAEAEGEAYANPFILSDDDELIEAVRVKKVDEVGYIQPKTVDSARRRNLIATNRQKRQDLLSLVEELRKDQLSTSNEKKREQNDQIIENILLEIEKLERTLPEFNGEDERRAFEANQASIEAGEGGSFDEDYPTAQEPSVVRMTNGQTFRKQDDLEAYSSDETKVLHTEPDPMLMDTDLSTIVQSVLVGSHTSAYEFDPVTDFQISEISSSYADSGSEMAKDIPMESYSDTDDTTSREEDFDEALAILNGSDTVAKETSDEFIPEPNNIPDEDIPAEAPVQSTEDPATDPVDHMIKMDEFDPTLNFPDNSFNPIDAFLSDFGGFGDL